MQQIVREHEGTGMTMLVKPRPASDLPVLRLSAADAREIAARGLVAFQNAVKDLLEQRGGREVRVRYSGPDSVSAVGSSYFSLVDPDPEFLAGLIGGELGRVSYWSVADYEITWVSVLLQAAGRPELAADIRARAGAL